MLDRVTDLESLAKREVREEDVLLQHIADATLPALAEPLAVEPDVTGRQFDAPGQTVEQRSLAAAGGTHDSEQLARLDNTRHVAQHLPLVQRHCEAVEHQLQRTVRQVVMLVRQAC